jgi:hypothetical protein
VRWSTLLLTFLVLLALGLMLVRSGNDSPASVSGFELKLRSLLDQILIVRPRSKEFLFGHPLLLISLSLFALRNSLFNESMRENVGAWAAGLLTLSVVGQVGIVNTFCHLHTPLFVSSLRVLIGILLGAAIGIVVTWVLKQTFLSRISLSRNDATLGNNATS